MALILGGCRTGGYEVFPKNLVWIGLLVLFHGVLTLSSTSAEELKATPYRPTVSNPAYLPVPNALEVEMGWQSVKLKDRDDAYRHSLPYLLKFAFTNRVGMLVGGEAAILKDEPGSPTQSGFGDVAALLKYAHPLKTTLPSALGLEAGVRFPTAPSTVGTDQRAYHLNGIYSLAVYRIGLDFNLLYTKLDDAPGNEGKHELGWVTTASYSVTDQLSLAGELFGSHREGVRPFLQYLSAVSYAIHPRLVGDAGMAFGLTGASQKWTLFLGLTILAWSPEN